MRMPYLDIALKRKIDQLKELYGLSKDGEIIKMAVHRLWILEVRDKKIMYDENTIESTNGERKWKELKEKSKSTIQ